MFSWIKVKKFLYVAFVLLAMTAILGGCDSDPDPEFPITGTFAPYYLIGKWVDPAFLDGYEITLGLDVHYITQFSPDFEWEGVVYPGSTKGGIIRSVTQFTFDSGVIIYEYTENAPVAGNPFTAIYYKDFNFTNFSAKMSTVIGPAPGYANVDVATLEEAIAKFTLDTTGDYIGFWGGPYVKQ